MRADCLVCFRCSRGAAEWLIASIKYIVFIVRGVNSLKNAQKCIDKSVNTIYVCKMKASARRAHGKEIRLYEEKHGR